MNPAINQMITDIIAREGGYVDNPADHGGPTNHGITATAYADYFKQAQHSVSPANIKMITPELAANIYLRLYYIRPGINFLPTDLQPIILDMAVNSGPVVAIKQLQQLLLKNYYPLGLVDGVIGVQTISAANRALADLGNALINDLVNLRVEYYQHLISHDPSQKQFSKGWQARAESFRPVAA